MESEPAPHERLWPDPESGPFRLRLWFGKVDGRPAVVGVEMWGIEPAGPMPWNDWSIRSTARNADDNPFAFEPAPPLPDVAIGAAAIRLPLGAMLDGWTQGNKALGRAAIAWGAQPEAVAEAMEQFEGPKKKGARPLPDALLRTVAHYYTEAVEAGDRSPAKAVVRRFKSDDNRSVNPATARSWIAAARRRQILAIPSRRVHDKKETQS